MDKRPCEEALSAKLVYETSASLSLKKTPLGGRRLLVTAKACVRHTNSTHTCTGINSHMRVRNSQISKVFGKFKFGITHLSVHPLAIFILLIS